MGHERLRYLEETLLSAIEGQMCNIAEADAGELGEAVDMLKDIEEAIYFRTITDAMGGKGKYGVEMEIESGEPKERHMEKEKMYYSEPYMTSSYEKMYKPNNGNRNGGGNSNGYYPELKQMTERDYREGRSPQSRRMYMEAKELGGDKTSQMRDLEKYIQELSQDMVEMISDASPEEKQYLEKKIGALATKIGQMK